MRRIILMLMLLPVLVLFAEKKIQINISWKELFPDHLERVYIIMKDGQIFGHTSQYKNKIELNIGILEKRLKEIKNKDYCIKEIKIVIHNHHRSKRFTHADYEQYWTFKNYGFNGRFLLYCHRTKKTYDIEDNKKRR